MTRQRFIHYSCPKVSIKKIFIWRFLCQNKSDLVSRDTALPQQIAQWQAHFDSLSESSCCVIAGSQLGGLCGSLKPTVSWHSLGRWVVMCTVAVAHAGADEWLVWSQTQTRLNQSSAQFPLKQYSVLYLINSSDCGALNSSVTLICLGCSLALLCFKGLLSLVVLWGMVAVVSNMMFPMTNFPVSET